MEDIEDIDINITKEKLVHCDIHISVCGVPKFTMRVWIEKKDLDDVLIFSHDEKVTIRVKRGFYCNPI